MAEKRADETVGLKPFPGKALRGASTVLAIFRCVCLAGEGASQERKGYFRPQTDSVKLRTAAT